MKIEPEFIGDFTFERPYYNPKRHKDLHPFCVVYRIWDEGKPEPQRWHFMKSLPTKEKAMQSAGDKGLLRLKVSRDGGKTYSTTLLKHAAAALILG